MRNYGKMSETELRNAYVERFGHFFAVQWGDSLEEHREEVISCLKSGRPQDMDAFRASAPVIPEGAVA